LVEEVLLICFHRHVKHEIGYVDSCAGNVYPFYLQFQFLLGLQSLLAKTNGLLINFDYATDNQSGSMSVGYDVTVLYSLGEDRVIKVLIIVHFKHTFDEF